MRLFSKPLRLSAFQRRSIKAVLHFGILTYISTLFTLAVQDKLGADPVKALLHDTGIASLLLLLVSLSISPAAKWIPCADLMKFRRLLGLYAFFMSVTHIATYIAFELQFDLLVVIEDIIKRPYITVGLCAFLILFALAATSPHRVKRRMGATWQTLHNGVYVALILALLHFSWSVKTVLQDPLIYWLAGIILLSYRGYERLKRRRIRRQYKR
ncbi:sulfoxide reductase heme-binding subunit YedZ [Alteromonas sediminis]|uniref:Protein-methionine-sulfoxide reductase heme-binding subunit MsrQ n=1 Tax=Alteromonas sediminis TaxID=2259342 RepID=A0A3N5Y1G6_9ALTE|nr:sulfoxide reductase heme-binding subunit YedZ [Alteromonas sediminis]